MKRINFFCLTERKNWRSGTANRVEILLQSKSVKLIDRVSEITVVVVPSRYAVSKRLLRRPTITRSQRTRLTR